jgi:hypothetical protein
VRGNRETVAGELLLTYDPTPGTWMDWIMMTEDANLLLVLDLCSVIYLLVKMQRLEFFADGRTTFAFQTRLQPTIYGEHTYSLKTD